LSDKRLLILLEGWRAGASGEHAGPNGHSNRLNDDCNGQTIDRARSLVTCNARLVNENSATISCKAQTIGRNA
jgi:hypothetical protein